MAKSITMRRVRNKLECFDPWSAEQLESLKEGVDLNVTVTLKRSLSQLNLYWAGLGYAVEHFDDGLALRYPTAKKLHRTMLIELGYSDVIYRIDGSIIVTEDSIAFDKMEQDDFNVYFERARAKAVAWLLYDPWDAWLDAKRAESGH